MSRIYLLNDVQTEWSKLGFLGVSSHPADSVGQKQSIEIAQYMVSKTNISNILASDAPCLAKLLHYLQSKSGKKLERSVIYTDALLERNFGVLEGTKFRLDSEIFTHPCICPEKGESVRQCTERVMFAVNRFRSKNPKGSNLIVSHSYTCQIIANMFTNSAITLVTDFWMKKGSYIVFDDKTNKLVEQGNALDVSDNS